MKLKLLSCLFILSCTGIKAQVDDKFMISATGGLSIPFSKYASNNPVGDKSGFAKIGPNVQIAFNNLVNESKTIGYLAKWSMFQNEVDNSVSQHPYDNEYNDEYGLDGSYLGNLFFVGLVARIPMSKLELRTNYAIGYGMVTSPKYHQLQASVSKYYRSPTLTHDRETSGGVAFNFGINLTYYLTQKLNLVLNTDYTFTQQRFYFDGASNYITYDKIQKINMLNVGLGFGIKI